MESREKPGSSEISIDPAPENTGDMIPTFCNTKLSDPLPKAIWIPSDSYRIYRGTPVEMILEMVEEPGPFSVRKALEKLIEGFAKSRNLVIQLPWKESEETLSMLFLHALLTLRICQVAPSA